jgi:biopolymer transport protein ExbD
MRFTSHQRKRAPSVIIVSLIDVLLVVLIFLMVTTTAKKVEHTLKVNLPVSKEAKPGATETKPFVILVSSNFPYFFLGDRAVTYDKLERELAEAVKNDPQLKVSIKADRQAPVGEFVKLIDATTAAHVASLSIITEKQAKN